MKEITGTIFVCEKCAKFTSTKKGEMNAHENQCLHNQIKNSKNADKKKIYDCLDPREINKLMKEFIIKYQLPIGDSDEYFKLIKGTRFFSVEIDKGVRGLFDINQFILVKKLNDLYYNFPLDLQDKINDDSELQIINNQISDLEIKLDYMNRTLNNLKEHKEKIFLEYILLYIKKSENWLLD